MRRSAVLFAACLLVLAACSSTAPPAADTAAVALSTTAPMRVLASADATAGKQVYDTFCGACHNGNDERAPALDVLNTLGKDRITTALSKDGLMALQSAMLDEQRRTQVIAFLSAPAEERRQLAGADLSTDPTGRNRAAYIDGIPYPARRIRAERDSPNGPRPPAWVAPKLADGPFEFESWEQRHLKVSIVTRGLTSPRAIEFLPTGEILIAERTGELRIVRDGELDPASIAGTPKVAVLGTATGFMDVKLHPNFASNGLIYLSYHKPRGEYANNAIFRGRWNGKEIVEGKDIFVGDDVDALYTKVMFGIDGKLYFTIGCPGVGTDDSIGRAQKPDDYAGKTLRLNEDGTVPKDNPFVGKQGYNPEIFTLGHRVNLGMTLNPWTNEFWVSEHGPQGGDEVNVLRAGQNYGWPVISDGRYYSGTKVAPVPTKEGMTRPHISYVPSIAPGGMLFYTGDKFPGWKRNLFVGSMRMSNSPRTGHLERIVFNENWEVVRSEMLLFDLHQRIRDVEQSPDGYLYVITDEGADSVLMKLEPRGK
jgi:glucose/arabinose dehydrogenase/mono/diheme cytochrome c family protein